MKSAIKAVMSGLIIIFTCSATDGIVKFFSSSVRTFVIEVK